MELTSEKIWKDHYKNLKAFTLSRVKDKDSCNDILQDVFIKIHVNLHQLQKKERVEQWIYQITRNAITDHFRKNKPSLALEKLIIAEENTEPNNTWHFAKCLGSFVKKLPAKYKQAIELVELNNLSQLQLAEKLNISYSGAKSRVQRGRELLKSLVSECCNVATDKYGNIISYKSTCSACII